MDSASSICARFDHMKIFFKCLGTATVGDIYFAPPFHRDHQSIPRVFVSTHGLDALPSDPLVEVTIEEPHPRSRQLYERNSSFLDETADETFGAPKSIGGSADIEKWSINVFEI